MTIISQEDINNIRSNANIVDIISSYIPLQKKGKDYKCICPFHDDNHPSMSVSFEKQIYKCFSCNAAGNVFTFVKDYESVSFVEAVSIVANKIGYNLNGKVSVPVVSKFSEEYEIMELTNKYYQNNLNTNKGKLAKKYLLDRGIEDEIIKDFEIGLALDEKNSLCELLLKKGYKEDTLIKLGLVNKTNNGFYDAFTGRITFPLHDKDGNIIGFSCRIYRNEDTSKYINTKDTLIYTKGDNLFNYHRAKNEAKKEKKLLIVEGQMDAIRVYANKIKNVVALMGTALTKEQIKLIKALRCSVILCLDGDKPGSDATILNSDLLTKENIMVQVIRLSDYKDPDEYILNKGIDAFKDNIAKPIDFIDFKINAEKSNYDLNNSEQLSIYINQIISDIAKEKDAILKEISLNKISSEYQINIDILKEKLKTFEKEEEIAVNTFVKPKQNNVKKIDSLNIAIRKVLFYMMNDIKYIKSYQNKIGYFEDKNYRDLANEIVYYCNKNKSINLADFISYIANNEDLYPLVKEILNMSEDTNMDEFLKYIKVIDFKSRELLIQKLKLELKNELDVNKKVTIVKRITEIKKGSVLDERD